MVFIIKIIINFFLMSLTGCCFALGYEFFVFFFFHYYYYYYYYF